MKIKNRKTYQERKGLIKAENEKFSKKCFELLKNENEKTIAELSDEEEDLNILYKSTENLEETLRDNKLVICHYCKGFFESCSIFKHIGNNKGCKSFYGQDFERLKKKKNESRSKHLL